MSQAKSLSIDKIWKRVVSLQGKGFETITGKPFTYDISGDSFYPSRTKYIISKSDFMKALELVPIEGPGKINSIVRGPAYVWAVLHDRRVRKQDW